MGVSEKKEQAVIEKDSNESSEFVNRKGDSNKPDLITIGLRIGLAAFCGFTLSGIISGIIEEGGFEIATDFGSPFSLGLSMVLMIAFGLLFTYLKLFENKAK